MAQSDANAPKSAPAAGDMPLDDGYPLRGTVVLTLLYLLVICAGWGYVYYLMLWQG